MTKKISSVAEVISDKIVGNMIITKYFCQRTVKLQSVWGIFIKYSVDNLQHHFQDTLGWQRGYFALAWENGNSNAIQLLGSAVLNARYWLVKAAMVHILLLVRLQLWPKPCFWQSQYSWCLGWVAAVLEMELIQQQLSQLLLSKQSVKALVAIRFLPLLLERSLVQLFQAEAETRYR